MACLVSECLVWYGMVEFCGRVAGGRVTNTKAVSHLYTLLRSVQFSSVQLLIQSSVALNEGMHACLYLFETSPGYSLKEKKNWIDFVVMDERQHACDAGAESFRGQCQTLEKCTRILYQTSKKKPNIARAPGNREQICCGRLQAVLCFCFFPRSRAQRGWS